MADGNDGNTRLIQAPAPPPPTDVVAASVVAPPTNVFEARAGSPFVFWMASVADTVMPWGQDVVRRDKQLRDFWTQEPFLAGAIYTVCISNAAFKWRVVGPKATAGAVQNMLHHAQLGEGWQSFITRLSLDLLTQDNATFIEVIRAADSPSAPVLGIQVLDAAQCVRTGVPDTPVIYTDRQGRMHKMRWYQVIPLSEFPSTIESMYGVQYCLYGYSSVLMADGRSRWIADLVKSKDPGPVMAVNADGRMVPKRIVGWHKNPRAGRAWVNIRGAVAQYGRGSRRRNAWFTEDHPILTPSGYRPAGDIQDGDLIATRHPALNRRQRALVIGMVLGDSSLPAANHRPRLTVGHLAEHEDWLHTKTSALRAFGPWREGPYGKMLHAESQAQADFAELRSAFYCPTGKRIPLELVSKELGPELLAAWYCDDGSIRNREPNARNRRPRASIGSQGMPAEDVEACAALITQAGYECHAVHDGSARNLMFSVAGSSRLFETIAPFVPDSMRYKLPHDVAAFRPSVWELGPAEIFFDRAIVSRDFPPSAETTYCIDVEDEHNFISGGVVVHNCAVTRVLRAAQVLRDYSLYKGEKVGGRFTEAIHVIGGVAQKHIDDIINRQKEQADNEGLVRYLMPVIVGSLDPQAEPRVVTLNLKSLPEGFDLDKELKWYIASLGLGLGRDYQDFAPLSSGNLGTAEQSTVLHMKARGKGPGHFMGTLEQAFNFYGVMPRTVTFEFEEQDIQEDKAEAEVSKSRWEAWKVGIDGGTLSPRVVASMAFEVGELNEEQFAQVTADLDAAESQAEQAAANLPAPDDTLEEGEPVDTDAGATDVNLQEGEPASKARATTVRDLLAARIHEAFTVAADRIAQRGYMSQDQRKKLSGMIGDLLGDFNKKLPKKVAAVVIDAEDVTAVTKERWLARRMPWVKGREPTDLDFLIGATKQAAERLQREAQERQGMAYQAGRSDAAVRALQVAAKALEESADQAPVILVQPAEVHVQAAAAAAPISFAPQIHVDQPAMTLKAELSLPDVVEETTVVRERPDDPTSPIRKLIKRITRTK